MQGDLFTSDAYGAHIAPPTGEELKRQAIDKVRKAAPPEWMSSVMAALELLCACKTQITTDDLWSIANISGIYKPPEPRAMGAVMRDAAARGLIRKTDRVVPSKRAECHRRPIAVWEVVA